MSDLMKLTRMSCVSPTNKFISSDHVFTDSFGAFRGEWERGVVLSKCLFSQEWEASLSSIFRSCIKCLVVWFDLVFLFSHSFTNAILHCPKPGFHPVASIRNDSDVRVGVVDASLLHILYLYNIFSISKEWYFFCRRVSQVLKIIPKDSRKTCWKMFHWWLWFLLIQWISLRPIFLKVSSKLFSKTKNSWVFLA